jgi:hypothetical protein
MNEVDSGRDLATGGGGRAEEGTRRGRGEVVRGLLLKVKLWVMRKNSLKPDESENCPPVSGGGTIRLPMVGQSDYLLFLQEQIKGIIIIVLTV